MSATCRATGCGLHHPRRDADGRRPGANRAAQRRAGWLCRRARRRWTRTWWRKRGPTPSLRIVFGDELPSPYIDLGHFVQLIQSSTDDPAMQAAAQELDVARQDAVIAERHGDARPGSTGIAIYFPVRELYRHWEQLRLYRSSQSVLPETTQWDEFLAFHSGDTGGAILCTPRTAAQQSVLQELLPDAGRRVHSGSGRRDCGDDGARPVAEEIAQSS